jgi:hypothetical protein
VSEALAALREGAAALLDARGERDLARIVRAARVEIAGAGETWAMGSREVAAPRVAIAVGAEALVALTADAAKLAAVKQAFAGAMRSPDTELCELYVELLLPGIDRAWRRAYREAPVREMPAERADPEAVLAGAAALCAALRDPDGAAMLGRAQLEMASVPSAGTPLTRVVVRLDPTDRSRSLQDATLEARLRRAVHDAAIHAAEEVVVELGVKLGP